MAMFEPTWASLIVVAEVAAPPAVEPVVAPDVAFGALVTAAVEGAAELPVAVASVVFEQLARRNSAAAPTAARPRARAARRRGGWGTGDEFMLTYTAAA